MRTMEYILELNRYIISNGDGGYGDDYGDRESPPIKVKRHNKLDRDDFYTTDNIEEIGLKVFNGETDYVLNAVVIENCGVVLHYFNPNVEECDFDSAMDDITEDHDDGTACIWINRNCNIVLELEVNAGGGEEPDHYLICTEIQSLKNSVPESKEQYFTIFRIAERHGKEHRRIRFRTIDRKKNCFLADVREEHL